MFDSLPSLKSCSLSGEQPATGKLILREMSAGCFTAMHEKMMNLPGAESDEMSPLRFQSMIVLLSIYEQTQRENRYKPILVRIAFEHYEDQKLGIPECLKAEYVKGRNEDLSLTILNLMPPKTFFGVVDTFAGSVPRDWVKETYTICDSQLSATGKQTQEVLKND